MNKHTTKRRGFTMIELIFVIVILGILASVAIPKLAATRTDAQIASALTEITTLKKDLSAYYTSQGTFAATAATAATNVDIYADGTCVTPTAAIVSGTTYSYCVANASGTAEVLFDVSFTDAGGVIDFTPTATATTIGDIANALELMDQYDNLMTDVNVGGSRVNF